MCPVEKLALAVVSGMIVGHGSKPTQWKPQTLTGLIINLKWAIGLTPGLGYSTLYPNFRNGCCIAAGWTKKNAEQQERHFQRFLQASVYALTHAHAVTSSDCNITVLESADGGKKQELSYRKQIARQLHKH